MQKDALDDDIGYLDRCRHGCTAGELCAACDVIDLRDLASAETESR